MATMIASHGARFLPHSTNLRPTTKCELGGTETESIELCSSKKRAAKSSRGKKLMPIQAVPFPSSGQLTAATGENEIPLAQIRTIPTDFSIIGEIAESLEDSEVIRLQREGDSLAVETMEDMVEALENIYNFQIEQSETKNLTEVRTQKSIPKPGDVSHMPPGIPAPCNEVAPDSCSVSAEAANSPVNTPDGAILMQKKPLDSGGFKIRRRLNLSNRVLLKQQRGEVSNVSERLRKKWEGVDLPDAAKTMTPEELEELVTSYADIDFSHALLKDGFSYSAMAAKEEQKLGHIIQSSLDLLSLRKDLTAALGREPQLSEWAASAKMTKSSLQKRLSLYKAARNKLMKNHLNLTLKMASSYQSKNSTLGIKELCQLSFQGLEAGTDKWDPSKGVPFAAYIRLWVKSFLVRGIFTTGFPISAPARFANYNYTLMRAIEELHRELRRRPTLAEISERSKISPDRCRTVLAVFSRTKSLHSVNKVTGKELVADLAVKQESRRVGESDPCIRFAIDEVLDSLKPRESLVLRQRFGLDGGGKRSFGEISRVLNCSREMVRKYEMSGLQKMKHPIRMDYIWEQICE